MEQLEAPWLIRNASSPAAKQIRATSVKLALEKEVRAR
jgi:hypothetical protein